MLCTWSPQRTHHSYVDSSKTHQDQAKVAQKPTHEEGHSLQLAFSLSKSRHNVTSGGEVAITVAMASLL
jgi:hypothetical protein